MTFSRVPQGNRRIIHPGLGLHPPSTLQIFPQESPRQSPKIAPRMWSISPPTICVSLCVCLFVCVLVLHVMPGTPQRTSRHSPSNFHKFCQVSPRSSPRSAPRTGQKSPKHFPRPPQGFPRILPSSRRRMPPEVTSIPHCKSS